jgi:cell division protein FtsB
MPKIDEKLVDIEDKLSTLEDLLFVSQLDIINLKNDVKSSPSLPPDIKERVSLLGKKAEKIESEPEFGKELRKAVDDLNQKISELSQRFENDSKRIDSKVDDFLKSVKGMGDKKKVNVTIGGASEAKIAELEQKINSLTQSVTKLNNLKPIDLPSDVDVADLRDQMDKLKNRIEIVSRSEIDFEPSKYEERIRTVEQKVSGISVTERLDTDSRLSRIEAEFQSIRKLIKVLKAEQEYIKGNFDKIVSNKMSEVENRVKNINTNVPYVIE